MKTMKNGVVWTQSHNVFSGVDATAKMKKELFENALVWTIP